MSDTVIEAFRVVTYALGSIAGGLLSAILVAILIKAKKQGTIAPFHPEILVGLMNIGLIASSCAWVAQRALAHEPFTFFGTPWLLVFFAAGDAGLMMLMWREFDTLYNRAISRGEALQLKADADVVHADLNERLTALERAAKAAAAEALELPAK